MKVEVTKQDILEGEPWSMFSCPIALALQRASGVEDVEVHQHDFSWLAEVAYRAVPLPRHAAAFASSFDACGREDREQFAPFEFDLPDLDSPDWQETCANCCAPSASLNGDDLCEECAAKD